MNKDSKYTEENEVEMDVSLVWESALEEVLEFGVNRNKGMLRSAIQMPVQSMVLLWGLGRGALPAHAESGSLFILANGDFEIVILSVPLGSLEFP
jgi:hypothetical protein